MIDFFMILAWLCHFNQDREGESFTPVIETSL